MTRWYDRLWLVIGSWGAPPPSPAPSPAVVTEWGGRVFCLPPAAFEAAGLAFSDELELHIEPGSLIFRRKAAQPPGRTA